MTDTSASRAAAKSCLKAATLSLASAYPFKELRCVTTYIEHVLDALFANKPQSERPFLNSVSFTAVRMSDSCCKCVHLQSDNKCIHFFEAAQAEILLDAQCHLPQILLHLMCSNILLQLFCLHSCRLLPSCRKLVPGLMRCLFLFGLHAHTHTITSCCISAGQCVSVTVKADPSKHCYTCLQLTQKACTAHTIITYSPQKGSVVGFVPTEMLRPSQCMHAKREELFYNHGPSCPQLLPAVLQIYHPKPETTVILCAAKVHIQTPTL